MSDDFGTPQIATAIPLEPDILTMHKTLKCNYLHEHMDWNWHGRRGDLLRACNTMLSSAATFSVPLESLSRKDSHAGADSGG